MYTAYGPTHRKITLVAQSRREMLQMVMDCDRQMPVDDPVVIRCDGAQFICELYVVMDERPALEVAHAEMMRV